MIGFQVRIYRLQAGASPELDDPDEDLLFATWMTGFRGLDWIEALVKQGRAVDLGGDGYPFKYSATAAVLLPLLATGIPQSGGPLVIGDDYALSAGWAGDVKLDQAKVSQCSPHETLVIVAWDQS